MKLRKLTRAEFYKLTDDDKPLPNPTRPAVALRYVLIEEGKQGIPPRYAMDAVCDDGVVRTFVVGGGRG